MAQSTDPNAELSLGEPMGVIPAGTLLKTEFSAVIPDETAQGKTLVSKGLVYHNARGGWKLVISDMCEVAIIAT